MYLQRLTAIGKTNSGLQSFMQGIYRNSPVFPFLASILLGVMVLEVLLPLMVTI